MKPAGHRVLVKPENADDIDPVVSSAKRHGIMIAETEDQKRREAGVDRGVVVDIGPTAFVSFGNVPWCKKGDLIAFPKYSGKLLNNLETQERFLIINDEDVIAVIKEAA